MKDILETILANLVENKDEIQINEKQEGQEIVQEYRKGYKLGSKVIRHSMVVVNQ